jgi:mRNA interferase MazF
VARRLSRGDVWTAAGGAEYTGKPRPVLILQDDRFDATASITICPFTTNPTEAPIVRPVVAPDRENGLASTCRLMADKISTIPKTSLGRRLGRLGSDDMAALERAVLTFLGFARARNG